MSNHNVNLIVFNLLCIFLFTNAYQIFDSKIENHSRICSTVVFDKRPKTHTIVIDTLDDDWSINNCMLSLTHDYDRLIFSGDYLPDLKTIFKLRYFTYNIPNIVIFTRSLSISILTKNVAAVLFQSHWSLVNIVVVGNATFTCQNDYFNTEVNASIHKFLNQLWQKYQIVHVVIEYPYDCPNSYSTYDGNKKLSARAGQLYERNVTTVHRKDLHKILKRNFKNLTHGYPLKANIFYRFPTSITECDDLGSFMTYNSKLTKGYCGLDALVMQDVMRYFKFNASFEMETTRNYGYVQSGQVTGTLGLIVRREIDISFNSRFMVQYLMENRFDFLFFIWSDSLCALIKEPPQVPLWHFPVNAYGMSTWLFTFSCLSFLGSMMYAKERLFRKFKTQSLQFHVYIVNAVWSGMFGFFFNRRTKRSLIAAICLLYSVVLTAKYQGHVNYMFATLVRYNRLRTLSEVYQLGIEMFTTPSIVSLLGQDGVFPSNNPKTTLMRNLKFYPENASATEYALAHPNTATLDRSDVLLQTLFNLTDRNGRPLLYAVNECFQHYYLSFIVRTGFLFTSDLQVLMMKIVEAGLPTVYYRWTLYTYKVVDSVTKPSSEPRPTVRITIQEERIAFILLLLGYLLSIAVFAIELWWDRRKRHAKNIMTMQKYID